MPKDVVRDKERDAMKAKALQNLTILLGNYKIPVTALRVNWETGILELDYEFKNLGDKVQFCAEAEIAMEEKEL